jgi:hypothetical protein
MSEDDYNGCLSTARTVGRIESNIDWNVKNK